MPDSQPLSDRWECRVAVGEESGDVWVLEQGDTGDDLPDGYTIWTMVPKAEVERLREALERIASINPGPYNKAPQMARTALAVDETLLSPEEGR